MKKKRNLLIAQLNDELWGENSFRLKIRKGEIDEEQFEKICSIVSKIRDDLSPSELELWKITGEITDMVDSLCGLDTTVETERAEKAEELIVNMIDLFM